MYAGVQKGAVEVRKFFSKNKVNRVILLSDGQANVGPQTPNDLGYLGEELVEEGISVTTIGLGLDYNEDLMVQLARSRAGVFSPALTKLRILRKNLCRSHIFCVICETIIRGFLVNKNLTLKNNIRSIVDNKTDL